MSALTYGELFAGYGALGMGVQSVLGGEMSWCAEFDKAPSRILEARYPHAPNLGDVTKVDWSKVEPVDVITGGSPCQDLSHAGKRLGMKAGTRSGLWASMCDAIDIIRPRLVVWENVRGALSAEADSALEPCAGCVGDGDDGPVLRALGRVLGDLAELGFDAQWHGLRAADVGAPHGRFRVFVFAWPSDSPPHALGGRRDGWPPEPVGRTEQRAAAAGGSEGTSSPLVAPEGMTLLPTPAVNDMGASYTPETWDAWTAKMQAAHGNGNGHGKSLSIEAQRLLPTPTTDDAGNITRNSGDFQSLTRSVGKLALLSTPRATDGTKGGPNQHGSSGDLMLPSAVQADRWGDYAPAIARWETVLGRPAPDPTEPGRNGSPRLSPRFVEWMMGLPAGWVTDPAIGLTRNEQLKALGNGVVPAQSAAATRAFLSDFQALAKEAT